MRILDCNGGGKYAWKVSQLLFAGVMTIMTDYIKTPETNV